MQIRGAFMATLVAGYCLVAPPAFVAAAELWMIEEDGCPWCRRWNAEIGPIYPRTEEARIAPLRRLDLHGPIPGDVELVSRPVVTPTFILVENGSEVARIEGYPGEDFFWGLLGQMIDQLPTED